MCENNCCKLLIILWTKCMITILFHHIAIRMQRVCYARGCYNCNTNCDLKFFRFPSNPQL